MCILTVENIPEVPESYSGKVNSDQYWQDMSKEILSRSFGAGNKLIYYKMVNPFDTRVKTTPVPENLFQWQINSDYLLRVPDYFGFKHETHNILNNHFRNCVLCNKTLKL